MSRHTQAHLGRRACFTAALLGSAAAFAAVPGQSAAAAPDTGRCGAAWVAFKRRFMKHDGRIVDSGNHDISHSEGQAIAMFLAVRHADHAAFRQISDWTQRHLALRPDALLAWRYQPSMFGGLVRDQNNASDADIYHAWALHEAAIRWPDQGYAEHARRVARDLLMLNVRRFGGYTVLLPGSWGFDRSTFIELNPSYFHFRALQVMDEILPHPAWRDIARFGELLLGSGLFGPAQLPPDWIWMDPRTGRFLPAEARPHRFGFDAIRVPLHLAWDGRTEHAAFKSVRRFWERLGPDRLPAWVDLKTGQLSSMPAGAGVQAITDFARDGRALLEGGLTLSVNGAEMLYYDACLSLLVREAAHDTLAARSRHMAAQARTPPGALCSVE